MARRMNPSLVCHVDTSRGTIAAYSSSSLVMVARTRRAAFGCVLGQPAELDVGVLLGLSGGMKWEPVSEIEPLTCRLQEVRPRAPCALAAPMAHVIALTALAALRLSRAPFHETFHADGTQWSLTVTERSDRKPPQV
jgi:hypothetical protein